PWLVQHCGLTPVQAKALAGDVVDRFNVVASTLAGARYFDLRPTVGVLPATMWHDEIHFTGAGWEQVAQRWMSEITAAVAIAPPTPVAFSGLRLPAPPILRASPVRRVAQPAVRAISRTAPRAATRKQPAKSAGKTAPARPRAPAKKRAAAKRTISPTASTRRRPPRGIGRHR
ncbi:MAG: hypothetical protein ACREPX_08300, partial [Rhodanobacteraceae bacterium]